jgi:hypothetical protein
MLAHRHGQRWSASDLARAMALSDKTVRGYLDVLSGTFMVRPLQPWFENLSRRQVKAPKVYLRDSGILHALLGLPDRAALTAHPAVGASWEGFAVEQVLLALRSPQAYFWATHAGAEVDLFFEHRGRRYGIEARYSEAPAVTRSMRTALDDLRLDRMWVNPPRAPRLSGRSAARGVAAVAAGRAARSTEPRRPDGPREPSASVPFDVASWQHRW